METPLEIRTRWHYLRDLLIAQLDRFETGAMKMTTAGIDISPQAIAKLKKDILDFDQLIAISEKREADQS